MIASLCSLALLVLAGAAAGAARPAREAANPLLAQVSVVALSAEVGSHRVEVPVSAAVGASGAGMLGTTYRVEWRREGPALRVKATRLDEAKYWRLAVECRFAPPAQALSLGYFDVPIRIPVARVPKPGQLHWFWTPGMPLWLVAEGKGGPAGIRAETRSHHGFFLTRERDGSVLAQLCLDAWKPGESAEMAFRVLDPAGARQALRAAAAPRKRVAARRTTPCKGFIRVNQTGSGFVETNGKPWQAMGRNFADLPAYPAEEQERILRTMTAAGMNTTRLILTDCLYRPLPGVWNEAALARLRDALDRCAAHGVRVILCLELSACGYQYSTSMHASPCWSDLYFLDETLRDYSRMVERVVKPLRSHPALLAWDITNEPDVPPDPASRVQRPRFQEWLRGRYRTVEALRAAWNTPDVAGFAAAALPEEKSYGEQSTPQARDYLAWANSALAEGLIARARLVRRADPNHLITLSHGQPRLLRGHAGAELFDFWAPHTYDLWLNGPEVSRHVLFLQASLAHALPGLPRPVLIEEFGISEGPQFPDAMRAEHVRLFREAAARWGLAGLLHWWEMTPAMEAVYAAPLAPEPAAPRGPALAVYLPPSQEWNLSLYARYMVRRGWDKALAGAAERGYRLRFVGAPEEARGCERLIVLGDSLTEAEAAAVRAFGLPIWTQPGAAAVKQLLPEAEEMPAG